MNNFKEWLRIQEMGSGPYIGNCTDTSDYQVVGACSELRNFAKNKEYRHGGVDHKKVHKHSDKIRPYAKP